MVTSVKNHQIDIKGRPVKDRIDKWAFSAAMHLLTLDRAKSGAPYEPDYYADWASEFARALAKNLGGHDEASNNKRSHRRDAAKPMDYQQADCRKPISEAAICVEEAVVVRIGNHRLAGKSTDG